MRHWTLSFGVACAGLGSAATLAGAFAFQHLGGLAPCAICLWQRWPHAVAVVVAALVLALLSSAPKWARGMALIGAAAMLVNMGIALYHTGIERGWWQGPTSCSGGGEDIMSLSAAELLSVDTAPALVMCNEVAWAFAGLSMASWNGVICAALVALWVAAFRAQPPSQA
ncbi:disulfide bond formation protein B [Rhodobacteraceae bacterium XHP0102]|nr:disulfide bond formation protein B [Rhodobacteraceae bacterium XHP0102]